MSNVVDDRVVNMRFDNSNFEKNVSTSIGTLDKLKQSLDFSKSQKSLESLQYASRSFNMGGVADAIMTIKDRFSTMGVVGMTIIQNLTNSALGAISNVAGKISDLIISGGISRAMNIENAKFQLEGLGIKYNDVFDAIDYAVTNTAYSLDAAAQAAAQLSAAGLDYKNVIFTHEKDQKELTQMSMALRSVSGVAAQTQTDYSMVARYFQDVANAGKVTGATLTYMTQVLNLPVEQNLAEGLEAIANGSYEASESVQDAVKKLTKGAKVSTEEIKNFASKGLISFDMFSTIMFNKYADHAVDANRTLMGVMSNIRSAFAKLGAEFVSPIIEIDGIVVRMLDSIRAKVNELKPAVIPLAKSVGDSIKKMATYVKSMIDGIDIAWVKPFFIGLGKIIEGLTQDLITIGGAFRSVFPKSTENRLSSFAENFKKFGQDFLNQSKNFDHIEKLSDRFKGLFYLLDAAKTIFKALLSPFKGFIQGIKESTAGMGDSLDSFSEWAKKLSETLKESEKLKEFSNRLFEVGRGLARAVAEIVRAIGDLFGSFKYGKDATISSFFDSLVKSIGHGIINLLQTITGVDLSSVRDLFDSVVTFLKNATLKLSDLFSSIAETVKNFIGKVKESIGKESKDSILGDIAEKMNKDAKPLESIFDYIKSVFSGAFSFLSDMVPVVKGLLKVVVVTFKTLFNNIKEFTGDGEFLKSQAEMAPPVLIVIFLVQLVQKIKNLLNDVTVVGRLEAFLTSVGGALSRFGQSMQIKGVAQLILSIGGAIFLLALSLSMLADLDLPGLAQATVAISTLLGIIAVIVKSLTNFNKAADAISGLSNSFSESSKIGAMSSMMISMAASIFILAQVIKKLSKIPEEELMNATVVVEILMVTMGIIFEVLTTLGSKNQNIKASNILAMAGILVGVFALSKIVEKLSNIQENQLYSATLVVEILLTTMTAILGLLSKNTGSVSGNKIFAFVAIAASVFVLAESVKKIGDIPENKLKAATIAVEALLITIAVITKLLSSDSSIKPSNLAAMGVSILAIVAAMKILAMVASDFSGVNWGELGKAGVAFAGILIGLGALGALSKVTDANDLMKTSAALAIVAGTLLLLAPALMLFNQVDWESLGKAGVALAGLLVILALASAVTAEIQPAMVGLSIAVIAFGVALMSVGGGLLIFSMGAEKAYAVLPKLIEVVKQVIMGIIDVVTEALPKIIEIIKQAIIGGIQVIGETTSLIIGTLFKLIMDILHGLEEMIPEIVDVVLSILVKIINIIAERAGELASAIRNLVEKIEEAFKVELSNIDIESFAMAIGGITVFLVALAATATIVQSAMLGVLGIAAVMAVVTGMFLLLSSIDADQMLVLTQGLSMTMLSLAATMAIISLIPIPAAAMGVAGLAIVVAGIAAILAILGGLAQIPGFEWLLGEGKRVLVQIGDAIGQFVGSIISGFGVALTSGLPKIADNLSQFAVRLVPFIATMKLIDLQVVAAAGSLVGIITALTAADILNALTSWLTGGNSIEKFGEQIEALAPHLKAFAEEVRGINAEDTKKAAEAGKALAEMAKALPNEGGVAAFFAGENDMEKFGEKLVSFGKSLVAYAEAIADLDVNAVDKSAAAGKMVAEMAAMMPNTGGVAGFFAGENEIDDFGYKLERFGESLTQYSKNVADLNTEAVEKSKAAGQMMVDLAASVENTGGVVSWFTGNNDLDVFGEQLVIFGNCITEYSNIVADIDGDAVKNSAAAGQIMVDLEAQLKNSGGAVSWFTGDDSLKNFGHNLQSFGESVVAFSNTLNEAPNLQEGLTLVNDLVPAVEGMIGLANALVDTDGSSLTRFARSAKGLVTTLSQIGDMYVGEIVKQFTDCIDQVEEGLEAFVTLLVAGLTNRLDRMFEMGQKYAQNFIYGLGSKIVDVRNKGSDIGKAAVEGIKSVYPAFYEAGKNCIMGIVNGLNDPEAVSALAARLIEIAEMMMSMVQITLDEQSPSKKFMKIGRYAVEGLAIGLKDDSEVARAATELGNSTIDNMQAVIDRIGELIDENMDLNPTITPILDLSNVTEGASKVNDMFNRSVISGNIRANASIIQPTIKINDGLLQNVQQDDARFGTTFIQNNYSPKALSRVEIYRQTRNQFAQYREAFR